MNQSNSAMSLRVVVLFVTALLSATPTLGQSDSGKTEKAALVGRVLAGITSLTTGAGIGPQYQTFIFGVESKDSDGGRITTPVEILYAFHKDDGLLPDSFYDYSKTYELNVERDRRCDQPLSKLAHETNTDGTGKELPATNILYIPYGAPRDLLKPDLVLPCYVLYGHKYKVISQDAERITRCDIRVPHELQGATFTVTYSFDTENGKPTHIERIKNDALPDQGFTACISRWVLPSLRKGTVTFLWNPAEGWTMNVSPPRTD